MQRLKKNEHIFINPTLSRFCTVDKKIAKIEIIANTVVSRGSQRRRGHLEISILPLSVTTSNSAIGVFYHDMGSYSLDKREENVCIKISEFHSRWIISFTKMAEVSLRAANMATVDVTCKPL